MPKKMDMASSSAAAQMLAGLQGGGSAPAGMPPEMPADDMGGMPAAGGDPSELIDQLASAFEGAPQDVMAEAQSHLNALRELLTKGQAQEAPPPGGAPGGMAVPSDLPQGIGG